MRKDKVGNKLYRKITIKAIFPEGIFPDRTYVQHAGPRQGFAPDGVQQTLDQVAELLDTLYPWWEFRPVELSPVGSTLRFIFDFAGNNPNYVVPAPNTTPNTDSTTPESETALIPIAKVAPEAFATLQDTSSQIGGKE